MGNPDDPTTQWRYTYLGKEEFGETRSGRRIIGRDESVMGGVYTGTYKGEIIVVDPVKEPEEYERLYERAMVLAQPTRDRMLPLKKSGRVIPGLDPFENLVLNGVFDAVTEMMPYSEKYVEAYLQWLADQNGLANMNGEKVNLDFFIKHGVAVCRHQALAVVVTLELVKKRTEYLTGKISIDRNIQRSPRGEDGGHAWGRYTSKSGQVVILDVAQGFFGTLDQAKERKRTWDYRRPEEIASDAMRHGGAGRIDPPQLEAPGFAIA